MTTSAKPLPRYCNTAVYCDRDVRCAVCQQVDALADALYEAGVQIDLEAENYRDENGEYEPHGKKLAAIADLSRAALRRVGRLP